jgi:hypothetical protein
VPVVPFSMSAGKMLWEDNLAEDLSQELWSNVSPFVHCLNASAGMPMQVAGVVGSQRGDSIANGGHPCMPMTGPC